MGVSQSTQEYKSQKSTLSTRIKSRRLTETNADGQQGIADFTKEGKYAMHKIAELEKCIFAITLFSLALTSISYP